MVGGIKNKTNSLESKDGTLLEDKIIDGKIVQFEREIPTTNYTAGPITFVIGTLRHFTAYNIEIQACREKLTSEKSVNEFCSTKSMKTYRTMALDCADDIPADSFKVVLSTNKDNTSLPSPEVKLEWEEPAKPNGLIVTYQIEYKNIEIQNVSVITN